MVKLFSGKSAFKAYGIMETFSKAFNTTQSDFTANTITYIYGSSLNSSNLYAQLEL